MKRASFTLVELLVVIATIVLLGAILLSSLQNCTRHARAGVCSSNIRQMLLSFTTYENTNGAFPYAFSSTPVDPPPGGYLGHSECDRRGWWWLNHIVNYSQKEQDRTPVTWCPSRKIRIGRLSDNVLCGNYGVNQSICKMSHGRKSCAEFIGMPLRSTDISNPGQTLLLVDSGYSMINWWHAADSPPVILGNSTIEDTAYIPGLWINKKRALWPGQEEDAINGRHPNKTVNVGFADGHVSSNEADDLCVEKTNNEYKNLCPLWRPK